MAAKAANNEIANMFIWVGVPMPINCKGPPIKNRIIIDKNKGAFFLFITSKASI
ncbi:hypothetical protein D3C76_375470 [compost metagenome]